MSKFNLSNKRKEVKLYLEATDLDPLDIRYVIKMIKEQDNEFVRLLKISLNKEFPLPRETRAWIKHFFNITEEDLK